MDIADKMADIAQKKLDEHYRTLNLPACADSKRAMPYAFSRGGLFPSIPNENRPLFNRAEVFCQDGITINFSGEQFNRSDLYIWQSIIHLLKEPLLGTEISFSAYRILKTLKLSTNAKNYKLLDDSIYRLIANTLEIKYGGHGFAGHLIESSLTRGKNKITEYYHLSINPRTINLFRDGDWMSVDMSIILDLRKKPISDQLMNLYKSHEPCCYPLKIETLQKLCGRDHITRSTFKKSVVVALKEIQKLDIIDRFVIRKNTVYVDHFCNEFDKKSLPKSA